jgi:protein SCO1/2
MKTGFLLLFYLPAFVLISCNHEKPGDVKSAAKDTLTESDTVNEENLIFETDIKLTNQHGKTVSWNSFKGKPSLVTMIFTNCRYACPRIVESLKDIDSLLSPAVKKNVQFVLVSFDAEKDTPEQLMAFYKKKKLDDRWHLLHGEVHDIRIISNLLGISYRPDKFGNFSHSNSILAANENGEVVERSDELSEGEEKLAGALNELQEK